MRAGAATMLRTSASCAKHNWPLGSTIPTPRTCIRSASSTMDCCGSRGWSTSPRRATRPRRGRRNSCATPRWTGTHRPCCCEIATTSSAQRSTARRRASAPRCEEPPRRQAARRDHRPASFRLQRTQVEKQLLRLSCAERESDTAAGDLQIIEHGAPSPLSSPRVSSDDEPVDIDASANLELRTLAVGQPVEADRGAPLPVGRRDRLAFAEPAVEADREVPRRVIADRAAHSHYAVDMSQQRLGLRLAVAGAENHQLDRCTCRTERFGCAASPSSRQRCRRYSRRHCEATAAGRGRDATEPACT
jgi:hypothetical protein